MTAIYDKALKRKDFSGIVAAQEKKGAEGEKKKKDDKPKAGADVGKIVNLMAGDANRASYEMTYPSSNADDPVGCHDDRRSLHAIRSAIR